LPINDDPALRLVQSSVARKEKADRWLALYLDEQIDDLKRQIESQFRDSQKFTRVFVNVVKKVTNRRAMVYRLAPVRTFEGMDQEAGDEIYRQINANSVLKRANRLTKLFKTTALQVSWNGAPTLSIITPNILDAEHDGDPLTPSRIVVTHRAARDAESEFSDWTVDQFRRLDHRGRVLQSEPNPYGGLPFVPLFDHEPDGDFFLKGGDDLIAAQRAINIGLVVIWSGVKYQTLGQMWFAGVADDEIGKGQASVGPDVAFKLRDPQAKLAFAVPDGQIEQALKAVEFVIKQTAVANDLAANVFELDPKAESGAAKQAENRDLLEARQDDIELWRRYEERLFETLKLVVNNHAPGTFPEAATLSVDFGEIGESLSDSDRLENYQRRIDLGIWSPADALMADNPDIRDRAEAIEILRQRQEETALFGASFPGPNFEASP
jgi:hypothetical protein